MYEKVLPITLKSSSSNLFGNVDVYNENRAKNAGTTSFSVYNSTYLSVHKAQVNIVWNGTGALQHKQVVIKESNASPHSSLITQARWCKLLSQDVLVVTHFKGFQIFDSLGNLLLFYYDMIEAGEASTDQKSFCRGIACMGDMVCIGTCKGDVIIVECIRNNFNITNKLTNHAVAITAIASTKIENNKVDMASCDDSGTIITWKFSSGKFNCLQFIAGNGYPATEICLLPNNIVACGYTTGHLRFYDGATGDLLIEVAGHGRAVTGLSVATASFRTPLLLSASEDSIVRIWKITNDSTDTKNTKIQQEWSTCIKDIFVCGAKFCDDNGSAFAVTGYDQSEILLYAKVL